MFKLDSYSDKHALVDWLLGGFGVRIFWCLNDSMFREHLFSDDSSGQTKKLVILGYCSFRGLVYLHIEQES